jgi:ribosomal protein L40E
MNTVHDELPVAVNTILCPACEAELPVIADRCPHCGTACGRAGLPVAARAARERMLDNRWFVLILLFGVTAGFGLPLLWCSRGFSRHAKWAWSVVVIAYTALVLWLMWLMVIWICDSIRPLLR